MRSLQALQEGQVQAQAGRHGVHWRHLSAGSLRGVVTATPGRLLLPRRQGLLDQRYLRRYLRPGCKELPHGL
jgi:hypothetical protein